MQTDTRHVREVTTQPMAADGPDAMQPVAVAMSLWHNLHQTLSPIIGQRGVAALFKRSFYLTRDAHPCLAAACDRPDCPDALEALRTALLAQTDATAVAAHSAMLHTFENLLNTLIGPSLTERLLRPVLNQPSSGPAVQDTTP